MSRNKRKKFFLCLFFILLSACASKFIEKQEVIEIALEIASTSIPEYSGSQIPPFNIYAEQMTLAEARNLLNSNNTFANDSPNLSIWFVRMEGIWIPANVPDLPTQEPYRHLSLVIDSKTGLEIFRSIQP